MRVYSKVSHEVKWSRSVVSDSLRPRGLQPARLLCPWGFCRQEYWNGLPCSLPEDFPNPGIEPRSLKLQADSLPSQPSAKPKNTGVGSLSLLQGTFPTQKLNRGLLHCRQILYQLSYPGSLFFLSFQWRVIFTSPLFFLLHHLFYLVSSLLIHNNYP